jgi:hypothetical protein
VAGEIHLRWGNEGSSIGVGIRRLREQQDKHGKTQF